MTIHSQLRTTSESFSKKKKKAQHVAIRTRFILILNKSVIENSETIFDPFCLAFFNWLRIKQTTIQYAFRRKSLQHFERFMKRPLQFFRKCLRMTQKVFINHTKLTKSLLKCEFSNKASISIINCSTTPDYYPARLRNNCSLF